MKKVLTFILHQSISQQFPLKFRARVRARALARKSLEFTKIFGHAHGHARGHEILAGIVLFIALRKGSIISAFSPQLFHN